MSCDIADSGKSGFDFLTTRLSPQRVECARLIHALVGVSAEIVALTLDQSGRQTLGTQAVEVRQRGSECRSRQTVDGGLSHYVTPRLFGGFDGVLEVRGEQQRHVGFAGFERFGNTVEELRTDDAAATPDACHGSEVDIPAILIGGGGDLIEALGVGDDLGSVECLTNVFDEGLLLIVGKVQLAIRSIEALLGGFLTQISFGGKTAGEHGFGDAGDSDARVSFRPFIPAWSTIRSTSGLPVFLST